MSDHEDIRAQVRRHSHDFVLPGASKHYPPDLELEPVHLDIDLLVDLEQEACSGTVTTTLEARRGGLTHLELDAVSFVDLAVIDGAGRSVKWTYDGSRIAVDWIEPFAAGERRPLAITYRVAHPEAGLYFSRPTDAYPDQPWLALTDHETERARHWLPCIDLPNARPRLDFHLRAASRYTILANGRLVEETDHGDGTRTAHWQLDFPCPSYLTCFAVGDLVRADDGDHQGVPIAYFAPPPFTPEDLRRSFGRSGEMLAWMADKLAMPFPFPKYFQVAAPNAGGAMENISLVTWDDGFVLDETLAAEWTRLLDEINVHEMAHSYFGDAVVCRDYAHAWLKESWATYIEQVWFEDRYGQDERQYQYYRDAHQYFDEADNRYKRPLVTRLFNSSWDLYDSHLYPGGACRLHTLRCELGDEVFWPAVQDYLHRFTGKVVETEDFRRVLEEHSGRSLVRQFEQWFHSAGYPALKVSFRYEAKKAEGVFEVEQTQVTQHKGGKDAADSSADAPVTFHLRTDVGWVIDGRSHSWPIEIDQPKHTFVVPMAGDPDQVRFDPQHKVLHRLDFNPGDEKLRRQLTSAPDVIGRILAARELAKTGKRANIEALAEAYRNEAFWGARVWFARALGDAGVEPAIEALVGLVAWETDPLVLEPLLRACGRMRDERIRVAVEARLDAGLPYYRATAAAYEALGAQRDGAPLDRLTEAAGREGFGGHAQAGALRALAMSRRPEAVETLLQRATHGATSNRARPTAAGSLGGIARWLQDPARQRVVEKLVDLLRDPNRRVRTVAVGALQAAAAGEALGALEAYRAPLSEQEKVAVDRAMAAIRNAQKPKAAAIDKEVDELRTQVRKLRDALEKVEARLEPAKDSGAAADDAPKEKGKKGAKGKRDKDKKGKGKKK